MVSFGDFAAAEKAIGLMQSTNDWLGIKKSADKYVNNRRTSLAAHNPHYAGNIAHFYEWMTLVDEGQKFNSSEDNELNQPAFLDLSAYLKSLSSDNPRKYFDALLKTAYKMLTAQNHIDNMLEVKRRQDTQP